MENVRNKILSRCNLGAPGATSLKSQKSPQSSSSSSPQQQFTLNLNTATQDMGDAFRESALLSPL